MPDVSDISGMLYDDEPEWLYERAKEATSTIIEIGAFEGKSTLILAQGAIDGHCPRVFSIDNHALGGAGSYNRLVGNLTQRSMRAFVELFVCPSKDAVRFFAECSAGFIFIDGGHDYENIARDLDLYLPVLAHGGIVAVHDCNPSYPGIMRAVHERFSGDWASEYTTRASGSWIAWARKK